MYSRVVPPLSGEVQEKKKMLKLGISEKKRIGG